MPDTATSERCGGCRDLGPHRYNAGCDYQNSGEPTKGEAPMSIPVHDPVNKPDYYILPGGVETADLTQHLSGAGAQAVQYIVRATRIDRVVKQNPVQDLEKARYWIDREITRLGNEDY